MTEKIEFLLSAKNETGQAFRELSDSLDDVSKGVAAFAGLAAGVIATAGAIAAKFGDMADELDNASLLLGVNAQTIREWQAVGELANVSSEQMVTNLEKLSRAAGEAIGGNKELAEAFARIGITQDELQGELRDLDALFPAVIEGLRGLGDGYEQVSTAQELFSRGGIAMLGIVRESPEALAAATDAFRDFAGVVTDEEVRALADLKDRYDALLFAIEQRGLSLMAQGATVLLQFVDAMKQADQVRAEERVRELTAELEKLDAQLEQQLANPPRSALGQWALDVLGLFPGGPIDTDAIRERMAELRAEIAKIQAENPPPAPPQAAAPAGLPADLGIDVEALREKGRLAAEELLALDRLRTESERIQSEQRIAIAVEEAEQRARILASLTEAERIAREQKEKEEADARRKEALAKAQHYLGLLAGMTSYNKTFFQIAKVAAIANAVISTHQGAAQALKDLPFPANIAAAAAVVAAGVAQIAAIQQTQFGQTAPAVSASGAGGFPAGVGEAAAAPASAANTSAGGQQTGTVEIVVRGGDAFGRALVEALDVEINQRDQVFIKSGSRQAAELGIA